MKTARQLVPALAMLTLLGCDQEFEPPDRGVRVERAAVRYTAALFDTIRWETPDDRTLSGNTVYAERCRRCHGTLGRGDTEYAGERGMVVPAIVEPDWRYESMDSLRRRLYIGHEAGMPIFGDGLLTPREIDATAFYILDTLRPEVAGGA